jgi:SAM-dependent methyltransferase
VGSLKTIGLKQFWNAHSRGWDSMRSEPSALTQIGLVADALRACLPPGGEVIDFGCGAGQYAVALAERGFQVTAVDYSPAMLKRARQHATEVLKNVHFRKVDLNGYLPFGAGSFDGALCVALLQVLDDPTRFLAQVRQSLRPNGYLLV